MEIKAINIKQKDYIDEEDFFLSCEVFIGPQKENYVYEVYDFNVISIKRLYEGFPDNGIMLNKGWMIMKYYDESEMKQKINAIMSDGTLWEGQIALYFRWTCLPDCAVPELEADYRRNNRRLS